MKKHVKFCLFIFLLLLIKNLSFAQSPLMGWSSWNANFLNINESLIKETAGYMVSLGLKDAGYTWVNIDDGYFGGRDAEGNLLVNYKFPNGMKIVADYIHSKGLNAGIYSEIGDNTCGFVGNGDSLGIYSGLYKHEEQDLRLFFDTWGYDYIKVDYCGASNLKLDEQTTYTHVSGIIQKIGTEQNRKIGYNICRWAFPGAWVIGKADSWRMHGDIDNTFSSLKNIIEDNIYLAPYSSPQGGYNDMDMLQVGRGLSVDEEKTHFGMWSIMCSPLVIGCNLKGISESTLNIIKNAEVIAVNQDILSIQAELVSKNGDCMVFAKPMEVAHGKIRAVALFNAGDSAKIIRVIFKDIQLNSKATVRDLWEHKDLGKFTEYYETTVPAHGTAMLRIEGESSLDKTRFQGEYAFMNKYSMVKPGEARFERTSSPASGGYKMGWLGNSPDNWAEFRDVYSSTGGKYTLRLFYYTGENRDIAVIVNGKEYFIKDLNSGGFDKRGIFDIKIKLNRGVNVIRLANSTAWAPDIDKFELIPEGGSADKDSFDI